MKRLLQKALGNLKTIRTSLFVITLLCWLLPTLVLGNFMGTRFFDSLKEKTEATLISGAESARVLTLKNIDHVLALAKDVTYDGELSEAVAKYESDKIRYEDYFKIVRNYLERKYSRETFCDFAIFFRIKEPDLLHYTSQSFFQAQTFALNVQQSVMELCQTLDTHCRFYEQNGVTYLVRNLYNTRLERYGILVLGMNMDRLTQPVSAASQRWSSSYALQLDDYQIGTMAPGGEETGLREQGELLCYTQHVADYDYDLLFQIQADKHQVYGEMDSFRRLMNRLFLLLIPVCLCIMLFVQKRIVRPIDLLADASTRIQQGELGVVVPMHGSDELGRLGSAFSAMSLRIKNLIDRSYKEEIALRDARIQMMQSRINPHFLNNALEAINWQARIDGNENIAEMVEALSVLLNASMDRNERHLVPLCEELQIAEAYFYFLGLRFGDHLTVWRNIEKGTEQVEVPRLVIQTLIENAVEHGVGPMGGGQISLNIFSRGQLLVIEVINNGKKLSNEDLERIRGLLDDRQPDGGHLGIRNVNQRLHLLFGDKAGLSISVGPHGETVAVIHLPLEQSKATNDTLG